MTFYSDCPLLPSQQQFSVAPASLYTNNACYFPDGQPDMCEVVSYYYSILPTFLFLPLSIFGLIKHNIIYCYFCLLMFL